MLFRSGNLRRFAHHASLRLVVEKNGAGAESASYMRVVGDAMAAARLFDLEAYANQSEPE